MDVEVSPVNLSGGKHCLCSGCECEFMWGFCDCHYLLFTHQFRSFPYHSGLFFRHPDYFKAPVEAKLKLLSALQCVQHMLSADTITSLPPLFCAFTIFGGEKVRFGMVEAILQHITVSDAHNEQLIRIKWRLMVRALPFRPPVGLCVLAV